MGHLPCAFTGVFLQLRVLNAWGNASVVGNEYFREVDWLLVAGLSSFLVLSIAVGQNCQLDYKQNGEADDERG